MQLGPIVGGAGARRRRGRCGPAAGDVGGDWGVYRYGDAVRGAGAFEDAVGQVREEIEPQVTEPE